VTVSSSWASVSRSSGMVIPGAFPCRRISFGLAVGARLHRRRRASSSGQGGQGDDYENMTGVSAFPSAVYDEARIAVELA
jgi:hypothetical protein